MKSMLKIVVVLFFTIATVNVQSAVCQERHCIAVVDAGSSGSRLHIYAYDWDSNRTPIRIDEIWTKKIKPGFSSIEPKQATVDAYLTHLFADTPEQNIPVYFYATAGMRLLPYSQQQIHYQLLREWFSRQPNWPLADSKTITGREEGVLGWLAVNYQLKRLNSTGNPFVGVMDIGGASVQITFPVLETENIDPQDRVTINISGQTLHLFAHSFLGLGQTVFSQQFLNFQNCFAKEYPLPNGLKGNGSAMACQEDVTKLVNDVQNVEKIVKQTLASNAINEWYALGGVASLVRDKPFQLSKYFTNESLILQADEKICQQDWQVLSVQYPNNAELYRYCLFPAYYYALMVNGYGIPAEQPINYLQSGGDWSMGVVLHPL